MEIIYTKDADWLKKWDEFIIKEDKGSHLLLSEWVKLFQSYGFDYEFCICVDNDVICGGYAAVIAKALIFKFYIVPYGPIVTKGYEEKLNELIETVPNRAKHYNSCYCHITLPFSPVSNKHFYTALPELSILNNAKEGHFFRYVYSSNGLNWIDLKEYKEPESLLLDFKSSVRRDIRNSNRKDLYLKGLKDEKDIENAYQLCIENSIKANYVLRDWKEFKDGLYNLIKDDTAKFIAAYQNDEIKGALLLIKSGNYYTYVLGGTKKEKPDLLVGHYLQWEAIKLSMQNGFDGYNISLGGSKGVVEFKNSFNTEQIEFENSKYHWVLKPAFFRLFLFFEENMKPYKKQISKILSLLKTKK